MKNAAETLREQILLFDGGMGTLLQEKGLAPGELPERWNLSHSDEVRSVHRAYLEAGSRIVTANTFGANCLKYSETELDKVIGAALKNVRAAQSETGLQAESFAALDVGPTGKMLKPYGDLDFEDAVEIFAKTVRLGVKYGADLILIETMNDSYETKAAVLAAKENSSLPVFVSNAYGEDGKLMTGASPAAMVALLEGLGADAVGVNCSLGPQALMPVIREYLRCASVPVFVMPNAGLPKWIDGQTVYDVSADSFAASVAEAVRLGVHGAGGCCGTTPAYIAALREAVCKIDPVPIVEKNETVVSSYAHAVGFSDGPVLIGERINPTGKKRFKQALIENDMDYLLNEGVRQQEKGAHILDVNVGLPEIDEGATLERAVCELQTVTDLPLQIDTADPSAMERALRRYNGKPMINSVNGKRESMEAIFPLQHKYGGVIVALTLDENGIPETAQGRLRIAEKILRTAEEYGVKAKDIVFDSLAMTVSAMPNAAVVTVSALEMIRRTLGCHTSLGVSNVSFGLPARDKINSAFFAMALEHGLSAAILNPDSVEMMAAYHAYRALHAKDPNCAGYIEYASSLPAAVAQASAAPAPRKEEDVRSELQRVIVKGMKDRSAALTREMLDRGVDPLSVVNEEIIPALNTVGVGFENKTVFLPQLLMSAEAANAAFEAIKSALPAQTRSGGAKCGIVLATVRGDIHDIGKNIVRLLLENYGFAVTDLGKDVPPERIVDEAERLRVPLVGLSALMTTTVPAMEETIRLLRRRVPDCRIIVGGAVLTREYAAAIGADHYGKDAMETVRYAEQINEQIKKEKAE